LEGLEELVEAVFRLNLPVHQVVYTLLELAEDCCKVLLWGELYSRGVRHGWGTGGVVREGF